MSRQRPAILLVFPIRHSPKFDRIDSGNHREGVHIFDPRLPRIAVAKAVNENQRLSFAADDGVEFALRRSDKFEFEQVLP